MRRKKGKQIGEGVRCRFAFGEKDVRWRAAAIGQKRPLG